MQRLRGKPPPANTCLVSRSTLFDLHSILLAVVSGTPRSAPRQRLESRSLNSYAVPSTVVRFQRDPRLTHAICTYSHHGHSVSEAEAPRWLSSRRVPRGRRLRFPAEIRLFGDAPSSGCISHLAVSVALSRVRLYWTSSLIQRPRRSQSRLVRPYRAWVRGR